MLINITKKSVELMLEVGGRCATDIAKRIDQFEEESKNSAKVEEREKSDRGGPHVQRILRREIQTAPVQSQSFHRIRARPVTSHASSRTRVRPLTTLEGRTFARPSTALERRRAHTRPSTAMLVRAKTENLGRRLLGSINLNTTCSTILSSLPNKLEESEWENELAKHIVSLYNNKIVSEIKSERNFKAKNELLSPEEFSNFDDKVSMPPSLSSPDLLSSRPSLTSKEISERLTISLSTMVYYAMKSFLNSRPLFKIRMHIIMLRGTNQVQLYNILYRRVPFRGVGRTGSVSLNVIYIGHIFCSNWIDLET